MQVFQLLLDRMRAEFLSELQERCDRIDVLVMTLVNDGLGVLERCCMSPSIW